MRKRKEKEKEKRKRKNYTRQSFGIISRKVNKARKNHPGRTGPERALESNTGSRRRQQKWIGEIHLESNGAREGKRFDSRKGI
jgi:hypothetical protein